MKKCSKCESPLSGNQYYCSSCKKEIAHLKYLENPQKYKDAVSKSKFRNKEKVFKYLSENPCKDCGEKDPVVLQFDHIKDKKLFTINKAIRYSYNWNLIQEEISKCEVVCANCHTRRTFSRLPECYKVDLKSMAR